MMDDQNSESPKHVWAFDPIEMAQRYMLWRTGEGLALTIDAKYLRDLIAYHEIVSFINGTGRHGTNREA